MLFIDVTAGILLFASASVSAGASDTVTIPVTIAASRDNSTIQIIDHTSREELESYVKIYFADAPLLAEVAKCESSYRHIGKNGYAIRGVENEFDIGVMQINELYHGQTAESLGYDLYSLDGNLGYAKYLYQKEGVKPWKSSSQCWKRSMVYKESKES